MKMHSQKHLDKTHSFTKQTGINFIPFSSRKIVITFYQLELI